MHQICNVEKSFLTKVLRALCAAKSRRSVKRAQGKIFRVGNWWGIERLFGIDLHIDAGNVVSLKFWSPGPAGFKNQNCLRDLRAKWYGNAKTDENFGFRSVWKQIQSSKLRERRGRSNPLDGRGLRV